MDEKEFEGKTEEEAIDKAIAALGLNRDEIDVEVVESVRTGFFFRGGKVRIRVHVEGKPEDQGSDSSSDVYDEDADGVIVDFVTGLVRRMGMEATVRSTPRDDQRLAIDIETPESAVLIGKQGRTLEAIQLIANVVAGRTGDSRRVVVDTEDYWQRRERRIESLAHKVAEQVKRSGDSRTLEAMNPFERRLVHTTLSGVEDVETVSEGDGLYKRIRILYTGPRKDRNRRDGNR